MIKKNKNLLIIISTFLTFILLLFLGRAFFFNKSKTINIAYSADKNYVYPTIVSMVAAMENIDKKTNCKFTVLLAGEVSDDEKLKLKSIEKKYSNCSVDLVDMGDKFGDSEVLLWSSAMYYRLSLPDILKGENKCLYLDGDTIVRHDLNEIFDIDMSNYYLGGIRDTNVYINSTSDHYKLIGIPDLNSYVCSGVLLFNLEKMRQDNITNVLDEVVKQNDIDKKFRFPDQDALNKACYGHILSLPFKYGALAHAGLEKSYSENEYAQWALNEKDWEEGRKDPIVLHFTGDKPWKKVYSDFCKQWWDYAEKSGFIDEIKDKYKDVKYEI